jgi:hypothetical protein
MMLCPRRERSNVTGTRGLALLLLVVVANLMPAWTFAQHGPTEGIVRAVGVQQGTLLLETGERYVLAAVDPDATVDSPLGETRSLGDLHRGDVVEFRVESFAGMLIVYELHVVTLAFGDATGGREH